MPSTAGNRLDSVPRPALVLAGLVLGAALLTSLGFAQWLVLRRHVRRAAAWIWANVFAWLAGLLVSVSVVSVLVDETTGVAAGVWIGAGAGALMGATVATITGVALVRLLEPGR